MGDDTVPIYIGWDPREEDAYAVCRHSLLAHAGHTQNVIPLKQDELRSRGLYHRPANEPASTGFTYTRFLLPALCNYSGWALFVDCDFLFTRDIEELFGMRDENYALLCVQHDYVPKQSIKMDGQPQIAYPRKNWSSLVLWNCGHAANRLLTPERVNSESGSFLHRFGWLRDDQIGPLPLEWNWLVGEYEEKKPLPAALHFTNGGPWFPEYRGPKSYGDLWLEALREAQRSAV